MAPGKVRPCYRLDGDCDAGCYRTTAATPISEEYRWPDAVVNMGLAFVALSVLVLTCGIPLRCALIVRHIYD
jgi:hypothetical protein